MKVRSYQELRVWSEGVDWVERVYRATRSWPRDERFGLISQVRRAAVSVPANIAEGAERRTTGEFQQFLGIAMGSLAETETLLIIALRLGYLDRNEADVLASQAADVGRMLTGLRQSLRSR